MRYNVKLYFNKSVDEAIVQALLNKEFEMDEVTINGVLEDNRGMIYASVSVSDDIPIDYLKTIGNNKYSVISVIKENKNMKKENIIKLPEDIEIDGTFIEAGTKIQVQEKKELKENHYMEIASSLSNVRFDDGDPMDVEYIAQDIFEGIINGIEKSRYISDRVKDDVLNQIGYLFEDMS